MYGTQEYDLEKVVKITYFFSLKQLFIVLLE